MVQEIQFSELRPGVWYSKSAISFSISKIGRVEVLNLSGDKFKKEAAFKTSINWICCQQNCGVRLQTSNLGLKFTKSFKHNH